MMNSIESGPSQDSAQTSDQSESRRGNTNEQTVEALRIQTKSQLTALIKDIPSFEERTKLIDERLSFFLKFIDNAILSEKEKSDLSDKMKVCATYEDNEQFIDAMLDAYDPIITLVVEYPDECEKAQQEAMNANHNLTEVNRVLSYDIEGSILHIHAPSGQTVGNKITLYRDGFSQIAHIIHENENITEIAATSYLVSEHTGLFKRIGFTIEDMPDEYRQEHFPGEKNIIKSAKMSRKDFLAKFYKEN